MCFDRWNTAEGYYWFDVLWGPTDYGERLDRMGFRPGACAKFESADADVKEIYGRLVMRHHRLFVGYERYHRRNPKSPSWPGASNMPRGMWRWLESVGALDAVLLMTREA
jgi:hypothetical protein